ncbi:hypothetical protein HHK36_006449 [Tetracentron sinense]|uniref:Uncharacterized protein n=1 Tax=Tetracentron sinense TaxID=13715 RepID=A0A834ZJ14_TETSI|nr:hypothetical protein HHK36_006449 [Tetracentron sinense]
MLMWEDGFCRGRVAECLEEIDEDDPVRKAFSKMSIQLYNYGEGFLLNGLISLTQAFRWRTTSLGDDGSYTETHELRMRILGKEGEI